MNDIDELVAFRRDLDNPAPLALVRARARALTGETSGYSASGRRRRAGWLAVPGVAAAVIAVAVGVSLTAAPAPGPGLSPAPSVAATQSAPTPTPPSAAALIEQLAVLAEQGPAAPDATNKIIEVTNTFENEPGKPTTETYRIEPIGLIKADNRDFSSRASYQAWVKQQRDQLAANGPTMRQPTPAWLRTIDASPASLRQLFITALDCSSCSAESMDWRIFSEIVDLNVAGGVILPPQVRAGLLRLLGTFPGVTAQRILLDGRPVLAVGYPYQGQLAEVLADAGTGAIVATSGRRLTQLVDPSGCHRARTTARPSPHTTPSACAQVPVVDAPRVIGYRFTTRLIPIG